MKKAVVTIATDERGVVDIQLPGSRQMPRRICIWIRDRRVSVGVFPRDRRYQGTTLMLAFACTQDLKECYVTLGRKVQLWVGSASFDFTPQEGRELLPTLQTFGVPVKGEAA